MPNARPARAGARRRITSLPAWTLALGLLACRKPYRIGEFVLVETEQGKSFPAYITEKVGSSRYRVHFDGYDCDQEVTLERIKGRVSEPLPVSTPGLVPCARGAPKASGSAAAMPRGAYKPGDRVRVTWRGSVYSATVLAVAPKEHFLVHYEGLESAWDETVSLDRIVGRRP